LTVRQAFSRSRHLLNNGRRAALRNAKGGRDHYYYCGGLSLSSRCFCFSRSFSACVFGGLGGSSFFCAGSTFGGC
jgi:hypothetical protein